jgi:transporter family protein
MHWIVLSLISALFLGFYDLSQKHAVRDNAVLPVLFYSTLTGAGVWGGLLLAQAATPGGWPILLRVEALTAHQHLLLFVKSAIVASSWLFTYFAMKNLPVSLAAPIRATGPLWTLCGALVILAERPTWLEGVGIATTLASFLGLSVAGRREGVHFHRDKWVGFMIAGTLLGAVSTLYDKFLLGRVGFGAATVQAWFSIYLLVLFTPLAFGWWRRWWPRNEFRWRWTIPLIAVLLLVADFAYFSALRDAAGLVSLVASLRRGSTLVAFAGGLWLFHEKNGLRKLPAVIGVLAGIVLTALG